MPGKLTPSAPAEPTPEMIRAAKLARLERHRNRRPRHSASNPLTYDVVGAGQAVGPTYDVSSVPRATGPADDIEVVRVRN